MPWGQAFGFSQGIVVGVGRGEIVVHVDVMAGRVVLKTGGAGSGQLFGF
jgi:hypothetical protein